MLPSVQNAFNTWVRIPGSNISQIGIPAAWTDAYRLTRAFPGAHRNFGGFIESGMAYDSVRGRLYAHGGGHADYAGNEVVAYDFAINKWFRLTEPYDKTDDPRNGPQGVTAASGYYPVLEGDIAYSVNQPRSCHSYANLVYAPVTDMMYTIGRASTFPTSNNTKNIDGFDLALNQWRQIHTVPAIGPLAWAIYDPKRQTIWYYHAYDGQLYEWNPSTLQWTIRSKIRAGMAPRSSMALNSDGDQLFWLGANSAWQAKITPTGLLNIMPLQLSGNLAILAMRRGGLDYDPINKVYVAWSGDTSVGLSNDAIYIIDPSTWHVEKRILAGTPPVYPHTFSGGGTNGVFNRLKYIPELQAFVLVSNRIDQDIMMFSLEAVNLPPAITWNFPVDAMEVSGFITLNATATDDHDASLSVSYDIDNNSVSDPNVDTTALSNGQHILEATTTDSGGLTASASIAVTVMNRINQPPQISWLYPANGSVITDTVDFLVDVSDDDGQLPTVIFTVDGVEVPASFDTKTVSNGLHTLRAVAIDTENAATVAEITVTVANVVIPPSGYNTMTIMRPAMSVSMDIPVQFGRGFVEGEIKGTPTIIGIDESAQDCFVQTRWPDGSVQHAIFVCYVPDTGPNALVVGFHDNAGPHIPGPSALSDLRTNFPDFEATMRCTFPDGHVTTTNATDMLDQGVFRVWYDGPVSTCLILADHTLNRIFDVGEDAHRSIRPIFEVVFWHKTKHVDVRFIAENANTEVLQDQTYDIQLSVGKTVPLIVYTRKAVPHKAMSRWTIPYYARPKVRIDHNLAYLAMTKLIPNFDTRLFGQIPETTMIARYKAWQSTPHDLYQCPNGMQQAMGASNWLRSFGLYPGWITDYLFTFDSRMEEIAHKNADLAGAFPMHIREGQDTRRFDRGRTFSALGRVLSISARPTIRTLYYNFSATTSQDRLKFVKSLSPNPWVPDNAHQPDPYSVLYMLTGEYWYLEQLHFWAAWSAASFSFGKTVFYGRGPTGSEGGIHDQVRGDAWVLRTRARAALLTPIAMLAEKMYFGTLLEDAIAIWEGRNNITGTQFTGAALWTWGRTVYAVDYTSKVPLPLPLGFWNAGIPRAASFNGWIKPTVTNGFSCWMQYYLIAVLGEVCNYGFPAQALLTFAAELLTAQLTTPGYDPFLVSSYATACLGPNNALLRSWLEVQDLFDDTYRIMHTRHMFYSRHSDLENGYVPALIAATAAAYGEPNGHAAWQWVKEKVVDQLTLKQNPKWAILPRM